MITYVDTSTLLKRLLDEPGSDRADAIWEAADVLASCVIVIVSVEARGALAAAQRAGRLTTRDLRWVKAELATLVEELTMIDLTISSPKRASCRRPKPCGGTTRSTWLRRCRSMHASSRVQMAPFARRRLAEASTLPTRSPSEDCSQRLVR